MAGESELDIGQGYEQILLNRQHEDAFIRQIYLYYQQIENGNRELARQLDDAKLDLDEAHRSRRELQKDIGLLKQQLGQFSADCETMRNENPYVMVLIDGDGMIFNENLIRQGFEGGRQAAIILEHSVLEQCGALANKMEVMVKVCANIAGLSKAMRRDGSLENLDDLRDFALGFSETPLFDFVDVGYGKERADTKIKECMRWHLKNHCCKQILLGISHDAGYAPFLGGIVRTPDQSRRVTIIEGPPMVPELAQTGLNTLNFNNIFRSEKLVDRSVISTSPPPTWAGVTSTGSLPPPISPVVIKNGVVKKPSTIPAPAQPPWVPQPRGLDDPIKPKPEVLDKIKRRTAQNKLCNNHYLRGPCAKGDECCFEHDYKVSEEEKKAIAYLTRLNPCLNGQDCDLDACIYGHHCPSVSWVNGKEPVCIAFGCRFSKEDHPPGTVIKHPRKERWDKDYERY